MPDEVLDSYEALAETATPKVRHAMSGLAEMVREFKKTPRSGLAPVVHPGTGTAIVVPLEAGEVERMDPFIPWLNAEDREQLGVPGDDDCDQYGALFDALPRGPLRDAAYHLKWYAVELALGREPITKDCL